MHLMMTGMIADAGSTQTKEDGGCISSGDQEVMEKILNCASY